MRTQSREAAVLAFALLACAAGESSAQVDDAHAGHAQHQLHPEHSEHSGHSEHPQHTGHGQHPARSPASMHSRHAQHAPAGTAPVPPLGDADRSAAFPTLLHHHGMQHPDGPVAYLAFDRLEAWDASRASGQAWEARGWWGGDIHRLWLRSEGERAGGNTHSANVELLYGRSVSPWWDLVAGLRHDFAPGKSQQWLGIGIQGLAPYLVEVSATAYVGESGRSMLALEAEYDLLITNRLILQPAVEATFNGQADASRGVGKGLSGVEAGLRLRYELHRRFAPYVGVVHERSFGDTAAYREATGDHARDTRVVAGVRVWF